RRPAQCRQAGGQAPQAAAAPAGVGGHARRRRCHRRNTGAGAVRGRPGAPPRRGVNDLSKPTPPESLPSGAAPCPAGGAPSLAIVVKGFPRLSETFIAQEIEGLEQRGLRALLVS